ncbi:MAG: hypothetical protein J1E35_10950, partial [Lachnospiraceae bacterium]|nr:hypothetical protein [Lachnospiraceae bacterium]
MKRKSFVTILFLLTGVFCACNRGTETKGTGTQTPTAVITEAPTETPNNNGERPSATITPTAAPLPTATAAPEGERIPIDKAHFTSAVFREYISEHYDTDKDGYLSEPERDAVKTIQIGYYEHEFDEESLDGFEYFPNLVTIHISSAGEVVIRNHPALVSFGGEEGHIGTLKIENCPKLEKVSFFDFGMNTLSITGISNLELRFADRATVKKMVLDGNVALDIETDHHEAYIYMGPENEDRQYFHALEDYILASGVEWVNLPERTAPFDPEGVQEHLMNSTVDFFEFQVSELPEGSFNEERKKGWNITVNNQEVIYKSMTFPLYAESVPKTEDFFVRPVKIHEVKMLKYSPNRGNFSKVRWDLEFVYRTEQEETVLGQTEREYYVLMMPDGTSKVYSSLNDWEESEEWKRPLEEGEVRINKESFSSAVFRNYIDSEYNVIDYSDSLSLKEREAVTIMDFSELIRFNGETLDGFEHFPKLKELYL